MQIVKIIINLFQSFENLSEFEFSKYSPISSGKSLKALRLNVRYCAQNAQTFSKEIQYPSYWEALVDFSADKMYFPPNKSIKPNFINFIVEIQENAFSNPGFNQVPQALKQTMKSNSKYILYFTFSSFFLEITENIEGYIFCLTTTQIKPKAKLDFIHDILEW